MISRVVFCWNKLHLHTKSQQRCCQVGFIYIFVALRSARSLNRMPSEGLEGKRRNKGVSNKNSDHFHARAVCGCCFPLWLWIKKMIKNQSTPTYNYNKYSCIVVRHFFHMPMAVPAILGPKMFANGFQREVSDNANPPNQTGCVNWQRRLPESAMMSCPTLFMYLTSLPCPCTNW